MPITQAVHGQGTSPTFTRRVYYTGSDTLYEGYALCYNFDARDVTGENLTLSQADSLTDTPARRIQVEKPSVNNSFHFAGTVSNKSSGFTGPGFVEINMPGSVCNIYAAANCDHEGSSGVQSGQILSFSPGSYLFTYAGMPGAGSAVILGDVDRSSANGLVMAELMTGVSSGGVQTIVSTDMSAGGTVSAGGSILTAKITNFGVTQVGVTAGATADITYTQTGDGTYIGQQKVYKLVNALSSNDFAVTISQCVRTISNGISTGDVTFDLDGAGETLVCNWIGNGWQTFQTES